MILGVLVATLWQGCLVLAAAALISRCISKRNAATQYAVWYLALLALVCVPLATAFSHFGADLLHRFQPPGNANVRFSLLLIPLDRVQSAPADIGGWFVTLWAAGACVTFGRLIVSFARIARIRRNARVWAAQSCVLISDDLAVPIVAGVWNPSVILPAALVDVLSTADLHGIIEHERAHIRRQDVLANAVQRCIEAALYFNPCAWIAGRHVTLAREAACDDLAVNATGERQTYALCLARLAGIAQKRAPLGSPSALGSRHALVGRIERLMSLGATARISPNYYAIGGTVIIFAAMTLALQALSPAAQPALPPAHTSLSALVASASCKNRNMPAMVSAAAPPQLPPNAASARGSATIRVVVSADGEVTKTAVSKSSGNAAIDRAAAAAAQRSTFTPKIVDCKPVSGTYLFKVLVNGG